MTPSELLLAAADRIRDLAAQATPRKWQSFATLNGGASVLALQSDGPGSPITGGDIAAAEVEADGAWIAALSPAVAPHLEAWLRSTASLLEAWLPTGWPIRADEAAALHFALAVLGMTVEEAEAIP